MSLGPFMSQPMVSIVMLYGYEDRCSPPAPPPLPPDQTPPARLATSTFIPTGTLDTPQAIDFYIYGFTANKIYCFTIAAFVE